MVRGSGIFDIMSVFDSVFSIKSSEFSITDLETDLPHYQLHTEYLETAE